MTTFWLMKICFVVKRQLSLYIQIYNDTNIHIKSDYEKELNDR